MKKGTKKSAPLTPVETKEEKELPTENELRLQSDLEKITEELLKVKILIEEAHRENEFLQQEADTVTLETHEYLTYITNKKQKRKKAVISLSDWYAEQIREIKEKKEEKLISYEQARQKLKEVIIKKEAELAEIKNETEDLNEYKILQQHQNSKISALEKRVNELRIKHNESVQSLQSKFLEENIKFEQESKDQLKRLTKEAKKEVHLCLHNHSMRIKRENRTLRKELIDLIQKNTALHEQKVRLEEERKILTHEKETKEKLECLKQARIDAASKLCESDI